MGLLNDALECTKRAHYNLSAFVQAVGSFPIISHHSVSSIPMNRELRNSFLSGPFLLFSHLHPLILWKSFKWLKSILNHCLVFLIQIILEWEVVVVVVVVFSRTSSFQCFSEFSPTITLVGLLRQKRDRLIHSCWFTNPSPSPRSGYSEALTIINSNPPTSQTQPTIPFLLI